MAGVPISLLPNGSVPYTGAERFAFVQGGITKANTLASFTSYFDTFFITPTELDVLSGNWESTYNTLTIKAPVWDSIVSVTRNLSGDWNSVYDQVNTLSATWGNPGDFCGEIVQLSDITSCSPSDTISVSAHLDLNGNDIVNIGNSSLVYESGAKLSSNTDGGVHILPNPSNFPGAYGTTIGLNNDAPAPQAVASGKDTIADADNAFAHGLDNVASASYSFVGGGSDNTIDSLGLNSGILGGGQNLSKGEDAAIAGSRNAIVNAGSNAAIVGSRNATVDGGDSPAIVASSDTNIKGNDSAVIASSLTSLTGNNSVALGTAQSTISGDYGVCIGGYGAEVAHTNAKVFADSTTTPFSSIGADTFNIQAPGLRLIDGNEGEGYVLTCDEFGTGTWQSPSEGVSDFCGVVVKMDELSACGATSTISLTGDLDLNGGSLLNVGNNSIVFESGATISSDVGGNIVLGDTNLTNVNTLCANTIHTLSSFTHYQDILISELSGFDTTGDVNITGDVMVTGVLSADSGTSTQWNSTYTTVGSNSASWGGGGYDDSALQAASGNWDSTYSTVNAESSNWNSTYTTVLNESGNWIGGDYDDSALQAASGNWDSTYTTVLNESASWVGGDYDDSALQAASGDWNSTYTTVLAESADWESTYTTVLNESASWIGGDYDDSALQAASGNWDSTYTTVNTESSNWDSTYTTVNTESGNWDVTPIGVACSDETTDLTTGTAKTTFRMPYAMNLTSVKASVNTAPVGADITIDINEGGSTILSTKLTIDDGSKTSVGSSTAVVISDSVLADDAEITVDIDAVGSTTAGKGLKLWLIGIKA